MLGTNKNNRRPQEQSKDTQKTPKQIIELKYRRIAIFKDSIDKLNNRKKEQ